MKHFTKKKINFGYNEKGEEIATCPFCKKRACRIYFIPTSLFKTKKFLKCFKCEKKFTIDYFLDTEKRAVSRDAVFYYM